MLNKAKKVLIAQIHIRKEIKKLLFECKNLDRKFNTFFMYTV